MDEKNLLLDEVCVRHKAGHWFHTMSCTMADRLGMPVNDYIRMLVLEDYKRTVDNEGLLVGSSKGKLNGPGVYQYSRTSRLDKRA